MSNKYIPALAISLLLSLTAFAAPGQEAADSAGLRQELMAPMTEVQELPEEQEAVEGDWVPSEETNTVRESEIARKMTKEEKAENVKANDSWGGAITIISMSIVVLALIVLSILFMFFGKISSKLISHKKLKAHGVSKDEADDHHTDLDSGETIAAIAAALAEHFGVNHDMEDTILTIKRMKKSYSPWNSKIYNMRELPSLHSNPARPFPSTKK